MTYNDTSLQQAFSDAVNDMNSRYSEIMRQYQWSLFWAKNFGLRDAYYVRLHTPRRTILKDNNETASNYPTGLGTVLQPT